MTFHICTLKERGNLRETFYSHQINSQPLRYFINIIKRNGTDNTHWFIHVFYYVL